MWYGYMDKCGFLLFGGIKQLTYYAVSALTEFSCSDMLGSV